MEQTLKKYKSLFIAVVVGFAFLLAYISFPNIEQEVLSWKKTVRHDIVLTLPQGKLFTEVAHSPRARELGLSYREAIGDNEGLLFVFDRPGRYGFWMKDMEFPLDLVWINDNGIVVSIERGITPDTYPKAFINQSEARYVLEINSGMAEKFGLYLGSKVKITD